MPGELTRVLVTVHPGAGHLDPLVPLLLALRDAGHPILVATSERFLPEVRKHGVGAVAVGHDWSQDSAETTFPAFAGGGAGAQLQAYASDLAPRALPDLLSLADDWRPDLILRDATEYGGMLAAEILGLPQIAVGMMLRTTGTLLRTLAGDALDDARRTAGLPDDPALACADGDLYLDLVPPAWTPDGWPAPPRLTHLRHPAFTPPAAPDTAHPATRLDPPGTGPLLLMGLGTVNTDPRFLRTAVDATDSQSWRLIITVGEAMDPASLGPLPRNVVAARYLPHREILPRCQAVITHAGFGSTMDALAHGLPLVCLPRTADQPINAWRAQQLGVGLNAAPEPDSPFSHAEPASLTALTLRECITRVLEDPSRGAAARAFAERTRDIPTADALPALVGALP